MTFHTSRARTALAALVAALALSLVGVAGAQAKPVKVTGSTTVTPSDQAKQFLANNGVTVATTVRQPRPAASSRSPSSRASGIRRRFNGVLVHSGGLRFTKGDRSLVVRRFVAVPAGDKALVLAQLPGRRGNCGQVERALRSFAKENPGVGKRVRKLAKRYPKAARKAVRALRELLQRRSRDRAREADQPRQVGPGRDRHADADLELSRQAARLVNRIAGKKGVSAGAPLGSAVSTVTPK